MTAKEAIDILWQYDVNFEPHPAEEVMHAIDMAIEALELQSETRDKRTETHACDCISRQDAIDEWKKDFKGYVNALNIPRDDYNGIMNYIDELPSAQPEQHTCVNCGRTVNNGGWYADGRTRCPIEEHYALPKDGFCHLWEKRNFTDDDYPERREE